MHIDTLIHKKPDEKVIFHLRRHPIVFFGSMLLIAAFSAVPFGIWWFIANYWPTLLTGDVSGPLLRLAASAFALFAWLFFFSNFVDYYLDAWVVTNDRILNVEQHGMFARTVSELDLVNVQDVTSEVNGVLPYLFGYGTVFIQTAAERERFIFEQIPDPDGIRKRLLVLVEADKKEEQRQQED